MSLYTTHDGITHFCYTRHFNTNTEGYNHISLGPFHQQPTYGKIKFSLWHSFVLVCVENFFVCALLEQKLFKKQIFKVSGLLEK